MRGKDLMLRQGKEYYTIGQWMSLAKPMVTLETDGLLVSE